MYRHIFLYFLSFCSFIPLAVSQSTFTWDNANIYFLLTDRFNNGNTSNDLSYGRGADPVAGFLGGDFAGITQKISEGYFDSLGVNAIWFTAPYEQIHGAVPGYWCGSYPCAGQAHYGYHGYYPLDWTEFDANYGTASEFQAFVDSAHAHGIRLVMDIVVNHVGYETVTDINNYVSTNGILGNPWDPNNNPDLTHPDWLNWWVDDNDVSWIRKGDDNFDYRAPVCEGQGDLDGCLASLPDIRTDMTTDVTLPRILQTKWDATKEAQEVSELNTFFNNTGYPRTPANYIIKWLTDYVREYGIDAFRIDTYKHVETEVWGRLKDQAQIAFNDWKAANPSKVLDNEDFWMMGELFGAGPGRNNDAIINGKTDALINFNFQTSNHSPGSLESIYANYASITNNDPEWNFVSYISSHDKDLSDRNNLYQSGAALLLCPGGVQIYYGDESKRLPGTSGSDQDSRSFMNWSSTDNNLLKHWRKIGQFRQRHPSVGGGQHTMIQASPYLFKRTMIDVSKNIDDKVMVGMGYPQGMHTIDVSSTFSNGDTIINYYDDGKEWDIVSNGQVTFNADAQGIILMEQKPGPRKPSISITPSQENHVSGTVDVVIQATQNGTIYYSTDGSIPAATSANEYMGTFTLTGDVNTPQTVIAYAVNANGSSDTVSITYTFDPNPVMTFYYKPLSGCTAPNIHIWNVDGVSGDLTSWPGAAMIDVGNGWYSYSLQASIANMIFHCGAGSSGDLTNISTGGCYEQGVGWVTCPSFQPSVSISPAGQNFSSGSGDITLSGFNTASIYYTTDGSTPDQNSTLYTGSFTISGDEMNPVTVNAIGYDASGNPTPVVSETFTFTPANNLTFYYKPLSGCTTPNIHIWDIDGVAGDLMPWPGPTMVDVGNGWYSYTVEATSLNLIFNCNGANQTADILNRTDEGCYEHGVGWVTCPTFPPSVSISPGSRNFGTGSGLVTLTGNNADAVYYTTDGSTPTQSSTLYTGPFSVSGDENTPVTVNAIAFSGSTASTVATATYTFNPPLNFYFMPQSGCTAPNIYAWDVNGVTGPSGEPYVWPGAAMTSLDNGWYKYSLDATVANIIFNCGGAQTGNLNGITAGGCFDMALNDWVTCPTDVDPQPEPECPDSIIVDFAATIDSTFEAGSYIKANNIIDNGFTVNMYAGDSVVLKPGFHARNGSTVHVAIQQCVASAMSATSNQEGAIYYMKTEAPADTDFQQEQATIERPEVLTSDLNVYPNPTSHIVNIKAEGVSSTQVYKISIYNTMGALVNQMETTSSGHILNMLVNISDLPTGTYIVNVAGKDYNMSQKLMVLH